MKSGIPLQEHTKSVIGNYLPSSRALPLGTQMLVSYANIITRDAFLQSLLSCLSWCLFTSKSILHLQPKRFFTPGYHCWSCTKNTVSHILFLIWLGPSHQQDDFTGFQCAYSLYYCQYKVRGHRLSSHKYLLSHTVYNFKSKDMLPL